MADTTALPPIRRVLTGDDANGRSSIVEDGPSPAVRTVPERPGYRVSNMWRTSAAPSSVHAPDSIGEHKGISPPKGGTVLRIIDFPPEPKDPKELERGLAATFGNMYRDAQHAPAESSARTTGQENYERRDGRGLDGKYGGLETAFWSSSMRVTTLKDSPIGAASPSACAGTQAARDAGPRVRC